MTVASPPHDRPATSERTPPSIEPAPPSTAVLPRIKESRVKEVETRGVLVYGWGQRLWHWVMAGSVVALAITGYLVGSPPTSVGGEASDYYSFGTIRFIHLAAGMLFAVGFVFRSGLAIFGGPLQREIFLPRVDKPRFRHDFVAELKWYLFLRREPNPAVGHNPIAVVSMLAMFVLPSILMIVTGLGLYAEGSGQGSRLDRFLGWVGPALGGSQTMHTVHHLAMYAIVCFTLIHVYAVMRADVLGGQSTLNVVVSGYRYFRGKGHFHDEDDPEDPDED